MRLSQTPAVKTTRAPYNPSAIRRCVRRDAAQPAGMVAFTTKSFTRNDGTEHHAHVDCQTGEVRCTCENFYYDKTALLKKLDDVNAISIKTPLLWCKHARRAIANCLRNNELHFDTATKTYSLVHSQAQPVEAVPAHIHAETGELKAGYLANGEVDYFNIFDE